MAAHEARRHPSGALAAWIPIACAAGLCAAPVRPAATAPASGLQFVSRITDANRVGMTLTNYGVLGNNFVTRAASLEFPRGTGYEHLVHGGLWIGAQATDGAGAFTGVTTGMLDGVQGTTTPSLTEFTPGGKQILVQSVDPASPFYSPDAVSFQDLVALYDDLTPLRAANNPENHRPLRVQVSQVSHAWPFASLEDVLFLRFVVRNTGATLSNVWIGIYTEFVSVDKNAYSCWPPASSCSSYGSPYSRKWVQWDDSLRMVREHYCAAPPPPTSCLLSRVPPWIGLMLLTPPGPGQAVTLAAWRWGPSSPARDLDVERYAILSAGTIHPLTGDSLQPGTGDPVELLAVGPFATVASGDSVAADFAFVGGDDVAALHVNGIMAQRVYDAGYANATTPATLSLVSASAVPERVTLQWFAEGLAGRALRVARREPSGGWEPRGDVTADDAGRIGYEDAGVRPGGRYGYRLAWREGGEERLGGEAWVEVPVRPAFRLLGVRPNPGAGGALRVAFTLDREREVRLRLLDLGGRVVGSRPAERFGPGEHAVALETGTRLPPGVYLLEAAADGRTLASRVAIVR